MAPPRSTSRCAAAGGDARRHVEIQTAAHRAAHDRSVVLLRRALGGGYAAHLKRVLIIATTTGYQIRSFGEAAEKLGVRLVFASDRCDQLEDPWWDQAIPVRFFDEPGSLHAIIEGMVANPPDGVIAVGDRPVTLADRKSTRLNSSHSSISYAVF